MANNVAYSFIKFIKKVQQNICCHTYCYHIRYDEVYEVDGTHHTYHVKKCKNCGKLIKIQLQ